MSFYPITSSLSKSSSYVYSTHDVFKCLHETTSSFIVDDDDGNDNLENLKKLITIVYEQLNLNDDISWFHKE